MIIEPLEIGYMDTFSNIVDCEKTRKALVLDPGPPSSPLYALPSIPPARSSTWVAVRATAPRCCDRDGRGLVYSACTVLKSAHPRFQKGH